MPRLMKITPVLLCGAIPAKGDGNMCMNCGEWERAMPSHHDLFYLGPDWGWVGSCSFAGFEQVYVGSAAAEAGVWECWGWHA